MKGWWDTLALRARSALLAGLAAVLLFLAAGGWWVLRAEPAVLFSDLRPQDAALLAAELEKLKVPYSVADQGATLLVDRSQVHAARLKLMGKDLPLHGSVGFELFNGSDFGMTEFAQKINYQRALQGELTRTILSFPEIRDARVHLALPEQGLFRQNGARPKAAITLALRPGQALRNEQVHGIQRLVAAAVPGLLAQEVTLVDQQGIALTRGAEPDEAIGSAGLELKRELENYLAHKAARVLEQVFGPGQALASVDLLLNSDQVRVTTEDVIAAPDARGGPAAGVLVRERESARDSAAPEARGADGRGARGSSMQRDVEYQPGRRVEQVVSQPGAIRRIQVVAVVRQELGPQQKEELHRLVAAAVGASAERGDTVVVQALRAGAAPPAEAAATLRTAARTSRQPPLSRRRPRARGALVARGHGRCAGAGRVGMAAAAAPSRARVSAARRARAAGDAAAGAGLAAAGSRAAAHLRQASRAGEGDVNETMPEPSALHRAALTLHALAAPDQAWVLQALTAQQQRGLRPLLEELQALGIPRDAGLVDAVARPAPLRAAAPGMSLRSWDRAQLNALAELLAGEPPRVAAALLAASAGPWRERLLALLPPGHAAQVRLLATEAPAAPALAAATVGELERRLDARLAAAGRPSAWGRLRRTLASLGRLP